MGALTKKHHKSVRQHTITATNVYSVMKPSMLCFKKEITVTIYHVKKQRKNTVTLATVLKIKKQSCHTTVYKNKEITLSIYRVTKQSSKVLAKCRQIKGKIHIV